MLTRIHAFNFQNEFAKDPVKQKVEIVILDFFKQGSLRQCFVNTDAPNFYMSNTWESAKAFEIFFANFIDNVFRQVRVMGVKISILKGATDVKFSDLNLLDRSKKVLKH